MITAKIASRMVAGMNLARRPPRNAPTMAELANKMATRHTTLPALACCPAGARPAPGEHPAAHRDDVLKAEPFELHHGAAAAPTGPTDDDQRRLLVPAARG